MKNAFSTVILLAALVAVLSIPETAHAQAQVKVEIDNIEVEKDLMLEITPHTGEATANQMPGLSALEVIRTSDS